MDIEVVSSPPVRQAGVTCSTIVIKEAQIEEKRLFCLNEKNPEDENLVFEINSKMSLFTSLVAEEGFLGAIFNRYSPIEHNGKTFPLYFPTYIKFRFPTL